MAEFNQQQQEVNTQVNTGRDAHIDRIGDDVGGDKITVGDITGSYAAIGAGAQVIVTQVQQALSAVDEMEKGVRVAERRLAEAIQRLIGHYTGLTAAGADDRSNPYKSLLDYKLEDAPYFYGRAAAIKGSLDKLAQNRLMILHSESGSGKTSLLQAGLASRLLSAGHFPLYIRPYRTPPGAAVRRALLPDYRTQPDLARFTDEAMSLRGFLERVTFYLGGRRLYLFLDQFEEFFSEVAREDPKTFARELQDCVESDLNVRWVLSLRKEYFSDLRLFRSLKPYDNEFFLPAFNIREATEVIIEPAARRSVAYEAGLVERIVNDLDQGAAGLSPAQVQLVCTTLFDERPEGAATITQAQYDTPRGRGATGAEGILSSHLSRVLQRELSPPERVVAARALEALVTSEKRRAVKRRDELLAELPATADADPAQVLKTLVDSRLLRIDEDDASGEDRYELAHDYLLAEIELDPETQARKAAQELLARELVAYDRYGTLLSKERFAIIDSQRAHLTLDGKAAELLARSEHELNRQARRRTAVLGGVAAVFAFLAILSVVFALRATIAQGEAETQAALTQSQALAVAADAAAIEGDQVLAAQLGLEARRAAETSPAYSTLQDLIDGVLPVQQTLPHDDSVNGATWNDDESLILTWSGDGTAKVWAVGSETPVEILRHDEWVYGAAWNDDSSLILTWSADGTAKVWVTGSETPRETLTHDGPVRGATWNADESLILTWSADGTAKVWDAGSETPRETLTHDGPVYAATWNADESLILTWSADETAKVWDAGSETPRETLSHDNLVRGATWNDDESLILTWSDDGTAKVWDAGSETLRETLHHDDRVNGAMWNNYSSLILTWSDDGTTKVWEVGSETPRETLTHNGLVYGATWNDDESLILTWSDDRTAKVWAAGSETPRETLPHDYAVNGATWNADESLILTWSDDGMARVWEAGSETPRETLPHDGPVFGATWNADESLILTWSIDGTAKVWAAGDETLRESLTHDGPVYGASWNADESLILTWSADGTARVWSAGSETPQKSLTHDSAVRGATWNDDESLILTWSDDMTAKVWAAGSETPRESLTHDGAVRGATWNDDESLILTWSADGRAKVWEAGNETPRESLTHDGAVLGATWNADESLILTWSADRTARVWEAGSETPRETLPHDSLVNGAIWNETESLILTWSSTTLLFHSSTANVWAEGSETPMETLPHNGWIRGATWSNDESLILTSSDDGTAKVWAAGSETPRETLRHELDVYGATWNDDESLILTWSADRTARVWEAGSETPRETLPHDSLVNGAMWNADESLILTWSEDGTARVWEAGSGRELARLEPDQTSVTSARWNAAETHVLLTTAGGLAVVYPLEWEELERVSCLRLPQNMALGDWTRFFPDQPYRCTCPDLPPHPTVLEAPNATIDAESCPLLPEAAGE